MSPKVSETLRKTFIEYGELNPWDAWKILRARNKPRYQSVVNLFYCLRVVGLIEFSREIIGESAIRKRYYKIKPGMENDKRWSKYPLHVLYPATKIGALGYVRGSSKGRKETYSNKSSTARRKKTMTEKELYVQGSCVVLRLDQESGDILVCPKSDCDIQGDPDLKEKLCEMLELMEARNGRIRIVAETEA